MQDTKIGYVALKRIKYQLHETFDVIKDNPMDLNLLMEHVARLTSSVAILSEYLADLEDEREQNESKVPMPPEHVREAVAKILDKYPKQQGMDAVSADVMCSDDGYLEAARNAQKK